jgi:hypothetical protein
MYFNGNIARSLFAIVVYFFHLCSLSAQHWPFTNGARSAALAGNSICAEDLWAVQNNQAAMAFTEGAELGLHYQNPYLLRELSRVNLSARLPLKKLQLGFNINQLGFDIWQQQKLGIALARKLGKHWSLGIGMHHHSTRFNHPQYANLNGISTEIGVYYKPATNLSTGFHVLQPFSFYRNEAYRRWIRPRARAGFAWHVYDYLELSGELSISDQIPPAAGIALEYRTGKQINLRLGYLSAPSQLSFGLGYELKHSAVDAAFSWHPQLGFTPTLSMHYAF